MVSITATDRARSGTNYALWLVGVLAGLLVVRLIALRYNATDLFFDEAQYWSWSREPAFGYYSKPPLIAWLIGASTAVCGGSEFCIRLPSPIVHSLTALGIFVLGRWLYDARVGFWSALAFATLPGVSLSSGIISTDVPLLFFWVLALIGLVGLFETKAWWPALLLGAGLGLGLNAKYAMVYFALCLGVYLIATPARRRLLADRRLWLAAAIGLMLIAPNLAWNAANSFATFAHTADNAKWGGPLFNPARAAEFFLAQFGVFGPILFTSLIVILARAWRDGVPEADRLLLAFSVPIIVVVLAQALLSRAHANWAALAYVAASVLVTATFVRELSWGWLRASLAVHLVVMALIAAGTAMAGRFALPQVGDPFARTLGWRTLAEETRRVLEAEAAAGRPIGTIITDDRATSAELLYYLPTHAGLVRAWRFTGKPQDHFELTRPFSASAAAPALLVALRPDVSKITSRFGRVEPIGARRMLPVGRSGSRAVAFYRLSDYRGP